MNKALLILLPLVAALSLVGLYVTLSHDPGLLRYEDFGGDFSLIDQRGEPFTLSETDGKVRLLFFGFTHCPDICPTTLAELNQALGLLGSKGEEVEILFVSVDPERDTPERLEPYLAAFSLPVTGLTGTPEEVAAVAEAYGAYYDRVDLDSALGYTMDHSTYLYLLDREGVVRYLFRYEDPPERVAEVVRKLL
ncbi:MAG: SCO family protein [Planctomycetota bacterium]